jgi:hypothetical protein
LIQGALSGSAGRDLAIAAGATHGLGNVGDYLQQALVDAIVDLDAC